MRKKASRQSNERRTDAQCAACPETMTSPADSPASRPSSTPPDATAAQPDEGPARETSTLATTEASKSPEPEAAAGPSTSTPAPAPTAPAVGVPTASAGDWQAVWSQPHNAYYFYNAATQETTWTNPLEANAPSASAAAAPDASTSQPSAAVSSLYALQEAAAAQGIDPSLAYLDPSLAAGPSNPSAFTYTAKFNARTGAFARPDARDPTHLSEYERAKRMSEAYFDVNQWEQDVAQQKEEEEAEGKKRKRPTKKDLVRAISYWCTLGSDSSYMFDGLGEIQGTETTQEDRQDGMASYLDASSQ